MQDGKYMNVRIVELIFMGKDEREFSLMSEAHEKLVFWTVCHSKNLFTVVYWTEENSCLLLKEVLMKQVKIAHVIKVRIESLNGIYHSWILQ